MWSDCVSDLLSKKSLSVESRSGATLETVGYATKLNSPDMNFLFNSRRAICPHYACAELLWYLSGTDDIEMLRAYAPSYERFADQDSDGTWRAYGAYGKRITSNVAGRSLLHEAIRRLSKNDNTRQCVVSMWRPSDLLEEQKKDIPCTICWQFILRRNKLHMVVYMRSNDAWLGMPYDTFCFTCIQMLVAGSIGAQLGTYTHCVGSMHLYEKNYDAAREAVSESHWADCTLEHSWKCDARMHSVEPALRIETASRSGTVVNSQEVVAQLPPMLSDVALVCARKRQMIPWDHITSLALRQSIATRKEHAV
jgi:thymidylate synthase